MFNINKKNLVKPHCSKKSWRFLANACPDVSNASNKLIVINVFKHPILFQEIHNQ
jgi:hypothetical protein